MNEKDLHKFLSPSSTLYRILCLDRSATQQQIKSSYFGLVKLVHPDVSNDPDAHDKFITVEYAYRTLSNAESKAKYDLLLDKYELAKKTTKTEQPSTESKVKPKTEVKKSSNEEFDYDNELWKAIRDGLNFIHTEMAKMKENEERMKNQFVNKGR